MLGCCCLLCGLGGDVVAALRSLVLLGDVLLDDREILSLVLAGSLWRVGVPGVGLRRFLRIVGATSSAGILKWSAARRIASGRSVSFEGVRVADAQHEADALLGASAVWEPRCRVIQRSHHTAGSGVPSLFDDALHSHHRCNRVPDPNTDPACFNGGPGNCPALH